jgi:hypothetical protein
MALDLAVEVFKLRIPIGMTGAFLGLAVGLQAVTQIVQQLRYHPVTGLVAHPPQFGRQLANTLASPAQRRFWIPSSQRLDQLLQVTFQRPVLRHRLLASAPRTPNPPFWLACSRPFQLGRPLSNHLTRDSRRTRHRRNASGTHCRAFGRHHQAPRSFIQHASQ